MKNDYKPGSIVISNCPKCGQRPKFICGIKARVISCAECGLIVSTKGDTIEAANEWNYMVSLIEKKGDSVL